jgi:hypothetical protein
MKPPRICVLMALGAAIVGLLGCGDGPTAPKYPYPDCPQCTPYQAPGTVPTLPNLNPTPTATPARPDRAR